MISQPNSMKISGMETSKLKAELEDHLLNFIMPFWRPCVDWSGGGINNIVGDDGRVLSTDKYIWSQGRALWTFSSLYNNLGGDRQWLDIARNIYLFLVSKGRNSRGQWVFKTSRDGEVLEGPESVYVDAFVMLGMIEYSKAAGCPEALEIARGIHAQKRSALFDHSRLATKPHAIPAGYQSHGVYMIFANAFHELYLACGDPEPLADALCFADIILSRHLNADDQVLYEFVKSEGGAGNAAAGKTFIPGHAIESMWFLERIYESAGQKDKARTCLGAIRWHMEKGWDREFGGLYLAGNTAGETPAWHKPDAKVWWTMAEAMYALLRAYEILREDWCVHWYDEAYKYAFAHFPDLEHGEWKQNLDRQGRPIPVVVGGLRVKDPFHLPRSLIYSIKALERINNSTEEILS